MEFCVRSDLKGANVLLKSAPRTAADARGFVCKIADFGLSRVLGANRTHVSTNSHGALPLSCFLPGFIYPPGEDKRFVYPEGQGSESASSSSEQIAQFANSTRMGPARWGAHAFMRPGPSPGFLLRLHKRDLCFCV